jgi:alpha,alpha-trehalase
MKSLSIESYRQVHEYIVSSWKEAVHDPLVEKNDPTRDCTIFPLLPYPYVPPCIQGTFTILYYWDTYFTNAGLLLDGQTELAKDNVENLLYLLEKYGKVPNANRSFLIAFNSQPPYLHLMVQDVYNVTHDDAWLKKCYFSLKKEYAFWMKERLTPTGLNRYYHNPVTPKALLDYYNDNIGPRLKEERALSDEEKVRLADQMVSSAEAGQDFNPRFGERGCFYNPADLNACLYHFEITLASWAGQFEPEMQGIFKKASEKRKALMDRYLLGEDGLYYDYDFEQGQRSSLKFSGMSLAFRFGLSSSHEAFQTLMDALLLPHGVSCTDKYQSPFVYQWGYPFLWPGENFHCFQAAGTLGLTDLQKEIGIRYLDNVTQVFLEKKRLFEAYDAEKGGLNDRKEYPATEMLGWTAGTFELCYRALGFDHKN